MNNMSEISITDWFSGFLDVETVTIIEGLSEKLEKVYTMASKFPLLLGDLKLMKLKLKGNLFSKFP